MRDRPVSEQEEAAISGQMDHWSRSPSGGR
jgi:hypothetical protein